jgi:hypothetical protein
VQLPGSYSPLTGELLTDSEVEHLSKWKLNTFTSIVFMFVAQTWYVQKDLITMAIKNHMIQRQQT